MSHVIFSDWQVKAYLDGRLSVFCTPVSPQPEEVHGNEPYWHVGGYRLREGVASPLRCPYIVGQPVLVKEVFCLEGNFNLCCDDQPPFNDGRPVKQYNDPTYGTFWEQAHYKATDPTPELVYESDGDGFAPKVRWCSPITMPTWASRFSPTVTNVECKMLGDITEDEAKACGVYGDRGQWATKSKIDAKHKWAWFVTIEKGDKKCLTE